MKLISLNAACRITGYLRGCIFSMIAGNRFPQPVERRSGTLMFNLDEVCEWDEINRQKLLPGKDVAYLLNVSINELNALENSCAGFPVPVSKAHNPFFSKWNNGEILDWRAKYWRSY